MDREIPARESETGFLPKIGREDA